MPTLILSTFALLGCVFLIWVFFHWLREELNPKRPVRRKASAALRSSGALAGGRYNGKNRIAR
jgi:hypothetical protein